MRRFSAAQVLAALVSLGFLVSIAGCSGSGAVKTPVAASITLTPTTLSVNEGQVVTITATAYDSTGAVVAVDYTYSSSNSALASVSAAGLVCGGVFDSNSIVCSPNGDGQATITVISGNVSATATVYVHKQVDRVVIAPFGDCESMGTILNPSANAYNTSAPGCSLTAPCDITSTVGPFVYGSGDATVAASAAGIEPNFSSTTNSPTYSSGGTITGSKGQTCNLTDFSVGGGTGINPTYDQATKSPTYVSGGSITGTVGQTCNLSGFNGVSNATALVTLTDTNLIATGAQLTITNPGFNGGTTPPTTATLSSGTATCTGTATVITQLQTTVGVDPVINATGTVTLTGSNTIASGTQLTITNQGYGAVQPPTTATLSSGTATCTGTASVITALNSATGLEAQSPGSTALFASVAGVNSVGTPFTVCPVQSILVHDANSSATYFSLNGGQTQNLVADVLDSKGQSIKPILTWATSEPGAASLSSENATASIAGIGPGVTSVTATCITPNCNVNLSPQYSSNVVTAAVGGQSPDIVYVASSQSLTMVPIPAVTNVVGAAITLPNYPNSIVASPDGLNVFIGSYTGVMVYNTTNGVSVLPFNGKVLAVTPDGTTILVADRDGNATYFYSNSNAAKVATALGVATAGTMTPDSQWGLSLVGNTLVREGYNAALTATNLSYTPTNIDLLAQGSLAFVTSNSAHSVDVRSTCNESDLQTLTASNPTFVQRIPNGNGAVVVDSPQIDVITTPQPSGTCPVVANSTLAGYNLGAGNFNPTQLLVAFDSLNAWVITDQSSVLVFNLTNNSPSSIALAGGVTPTSGGLTLDSSTLYVGASDGNVHRLVLSSLSDAQTIAPGLKDANSNTAIPDLVAVLPK
jgi:Bacterial Ig-like domain (group 2)